MGVSCAIQIPRQARANSAIHPPPTLRVGSANGERVRVAEDVAGVVTNGSLAAVRGWRPEQDRRRSNSSVKSNSETDSRNRFFPACLAPLARPSSELYPSIDEQFSAFVRLAG